MRNDIIHRQEISTLKQFYDLMAKTRDLRLQIVENIFNNRALTSTCIDSLANAHASLTNIPLEQTERILDISGSKSIAVDLTYEITELEKDIFYLENGEPAFIEYLEKIHSDFRMYLNAGVIFISSIDFQIINFTRIDCSHLSPTTFVCEGSGHLLSCSQRHI